MNCRDAALEGIARGWFVFPLHSVNDLGQCTCGDPECENVAKHPRTKNGLLDATNDPAVVTSWYAKWPSANVGVATGPASGITVLDVDPRHGGDESLAIFEERHGKLPPTLTVRTGDGRHLYFRHPGGEKVKTCTELDGLPGLDVRGDGGYVVGAGSTHASGVTYAYVEGTEDLEPRDEFVAILRNGSNGRPAPANKRKRFNVPEVLEGVPEGQRDDNIYRLAHKLRRVGVPEGASRDVVTKAAENAKPPFPVDRAVEKVARVYRENPPADNPSTPTIDISTDAEAVVDAAQEALLLHRTSIYSRGRRLVEVSQASERPLSWLDRSPEAPALVQVEPPRLRELMASSANWTITKTTKAGTTTTPVLPPTWSVEMLAARPTWPFPKIALVTETPFLREDGTIVLTPGFDEQTGVLLLPGGTFPEVSDTPSAKDVENAVKALLDPLRDFPFVKPGDKSAALAGMITPIARPAFPGPAPMFVTKSAVQGEGKTLLADVTGATGTGRVPPKMAYPRDDAEMVKCVVAVAIEALPIVLFDNATGTIRSGALAEALTTTRWIGRLLSRNKTYDGPLNTIWYMTGNNLTFGTDIARRICVSSIDAGLEDPESRSGFRYTNLRRQVLSVRPALVAATLTILRAYHVAGRPDHGESPMGSFEGWDGLVRGALMWAGLADPLADRAAVREEADVEKDALRSALTAWHDTLGGEAVTAADAIRRARNTTDDSFLTALCELTGRDEKKISGSHLGYALRRYSKRIVGGLLFVREEGVTHGSYRWKVRKS